MSARRVMYSHITCDGCGVDYENIARFVGGVRALAANDGWKHAAIPHPGRNWCRQVDLCPKCEAPK